MRVKALYAHLCIMVTVAQLVRASDCDSEGRGFDPRQSPHSPQGPRVKLLLEELHNQKRNQKQAYGNIH